MLEMKSETSAAHVDIYVYIHVSIVVYSIIYLIIYCGNYYMMDMKHRVCNNRALCISIAL